MPKLKFERDLNTTRNDPNLAGKAVYTAFCGERKYKNVATVYEALQAYHALTGKCVKGFLQDYQLTCTVPYGSATAIYYGQIKTSQYCKTICEALGVDLSPIHLKYTPRYKPVVKNTSPKVEEETEAIVDRSVVPAYIKKIKDPLIKNLTLQEFYVNPHLAHLFAECRNYEEIKELRRRIHKYSDAGKIRISQKGE
jgi:hypothetical protein